MPHSPTEAPKDWTNIAFLGLTPVIGVLGTIWYTWKVGFEPWMLVLLVVSYFLVGVSICGGYHRLFSHRAYKASRGVQLFYAFFGAMASQNSILWWSSMHRIHHKWVDEDWDPYNIKRGFWWAHIVWIFYKNRDEEKLKNCPDLESNPVVRWQHKWYLPILVVGGFGLPAAVGAMFGDAIAGLLWGGFLRTVLVHHSTFFVNSLAHTLGKQEYSAEVSARDNWAVALLTLGEGYHSFHHRFAADYRNGTRWYQWDPTKWFIRGLSAAGQAWDLRATPAPVIQKARMQAGMISMRNRLGDLPETLAEEIERRMVLAREAIEESLTLWRKHTEERAEGMGRKWRETLSLSKRRAREAKRQWREAIRMAGQVARTA